MLSKYAPAKHPLWGCLTLALDPMNLRRALTSLQLSAHKTCTQVSGSRSRDTRLSQYKDSFCTHLRCSNDRSNRASPAAYTP
jgi:hypothetical protein